MPRRLSLLYTASPSALETILTVIYASSSIHSNAADPQPYSSSSSFINSSFVEKCFFFAQPPICTIEILNPEQSQHPKNKSTLTSPRTRTKAYTLSPPANIFNNTSFKPLSLLKFIKIYIQSVYSLMY